MLPSGPPRRLRVLNDQAALAVLLEAGPVSRAELGRRTGLSKPGVADLLARLEAAGLIEKAGTIAGGGPGPAAQTWRVRSGVGYGAAVDVTPRGWSLRLLDLDGAPVALRQGPLGTDAPDATIAEAIRAAFEDERLPLDRLRSVAVGVPGAVDPRTGIIRGAPHLPAVDGTDLAGALGTRLGVPVAVENDVNLMALAALGDGVVEDARSFAFVWIDEGLGAAVVRDGALIRGFTGGAGEIDYVRVPVAGSDTGEKLGDLLAPAALDPLERALRAADGPEATDSGTATAIAATVRILALGLLPVVTVLDPEVVVLAGRYGAALGRAAADAVRTELAALLETDDLASVPAVRPYAVDAGTAISGAERLALESARRTAFASGSLPPSTVPAPPEPAPSHDHR